MDTLTNGQTFWSQMTVMHGGSGVILFHHTGSPLSNARSFLPARQMKFPSSGTDSRIPETRRMVL
jgi:hypothetical protein